MTINDVLNEWVEDTIAKDPDKYGSDTGGHELAAVYLKALAPHGDISALMMAGIPSVYRARRKFLEDNAGYDKRDKALKFRRIQKELESKGQTHIVWGDDPLTAPVFRDLSEQLLNHLVEEQDG